jgi:hypothetical protein
LSILLVGIEKHLLYALLLLDLCSLLVICFVGTFDGLKGGILNPYLLFQALSTFVIWWGVILNECGLIVMMWYWKLGAGGGSWFIFSFYGLIIKSPRIFMYVASSNFTFSWAGLYLYLDYYLVGCNIEYLEGICRAFSAISLMLVMIYLGLEGYVNGRIGNRMLVNFVMSTVTATSLAYLTYVEAVAPFLLSGELTMIIFIIYCCKNNPN